MIWLVLRVPAALCCETPLCKCVVVGVVVVIVVLVIGECLTNDGGATVARGDVVTGLSLLVSYEWTRRDVQLPVPGW